MYFRSLRLSSADIDEIVKFCYPASVRATILTEEDEKRACDLWRAWTGGDASLRWVTIHHVARSQPEAPVSALRLLWRSLDTENRGRIDKRALRAWLAMVRRETDERATNDQDGGPGGPNVPATLEGAQRTQAHWRERTYQTAPVTVTAFSGRKSFLG